VRALRTALTLALAAAAPTQAADFVGPEGCKSCHPDAYEAWRISKHARALESLSPQQRVEGRCLSCHAPDLGQQNVAGVSCETCHGGGQYYAPAYVMRDPELSRLVGLVDPSERACRGCHDASSPSLLPFDFKQKLALIDHWSAERARRPQKPPAKKGERDERRAPKELLLALSEAAALGRSR
jgi:formate-dependent nitrite reductase cytochrome c552 subunit